MAKRDYYDVLGVKRGASSDEIRRAYRKLARELHPDVNKAPDAAKRFGEVQEAYDVLSDDAKRSEYDRFGHGGPRPGAGAGGGPFRWTTTGGGSPGVEFDMDDLGSVFDAFFGGRYPGETKGRAASAGRQSRARRTATRQQVIEVRVPFMTAARGGTRSVQIESDGKRRTIDVTIPKGVHDGAKLRVRPPGTGLELVMIVRVEPHELFERSEGNPLDLSIEVPLTIAEATLGGRVRVPTLEGSAELAVPPGSASGRKLRLRGLGMSDAQGRTGDLYAVVRIVPPDAAALTEEERETLVRIAKRQSGVRTGAGWPS